jgi:hypothetical protein
VSARRPGTDALYLPSRFREALSFMRNIQDGIFERSAIEERGSESEKPLQARLKRRLAA